jgi:HK97 family phage major capsid protein
MHKSTLALAVACSLRFAFNDNRQIEELQDRLTSLTESANNIQARADAEKRPLTESETQELDSIFASFEATQADIERRERLNGLNNAVSAPAARRTQAEATPDDAAAAAAAAARNQHGNPAPAPRARTAPTDRSPRVQALEDPGKWGFRTMGEFAAAVRVGSSKGGVTDPRLVANAAPSTYGTEGVGADGGFLIPPDFRTEILKKVQAEDTLLGRTDQQTSSGNSFTAPVDETTQWGSSGIQAYWENEAGQMTASKPVFTEIATKLNKLTALVPMTEELLADATSMTNYLRSKAPEKMDFKVSDAILNGTGAGQPLGIFNSPALITVNPESGQAAGTVRHQNILDIWSRVYSKCRRNGVWVINQDVETQLQRMSFRDSTSHPVPIYLPPGGLTSAPYGTILGRPVVVTESAPALGDAGDISFIDFSTYLSLVKTGGIRSDVSIHLWFDYDITAFRFVMRVGGQPWWRSVIARKDAGSNTLSCFVRLGARA